MVKKNHSSLQFVDQYYAISKTALFEKDGLHEQSFIREWNNT